MRAVSARGREIAAQQRRGDRRDVLGETARAEREPQQRDVQRGGERPWQRGGEPRGERDGRRDGGEPRGEAREPAAPSGVERAFEARGEPAERDERMRGARLADELVDDAAGDREAGDGGQRQHQHRGSPSSLTVTGRPATHSVTRVASAAMR